MSYYTQVNYYDLLEVSPRASQGEIDDAYKRQVELISGNALATYGLFVGDDVVGIRQRIEDAHRVLSEPGRRRAYDLETFQRSYVSPGAGSAPVEAPVPEQPAGAEAERVAAEGMAPAEVVEAGEGAEAVSEVSMVPKVDEHPRAPARHAEPGSYDGPTMRAIRELQGVDLETISANTKIAPYYLVNIEDERFGALPPAIYLRSYLKQYADAIGLDPEKTAEGYLARLNEATGNS